MQRTPLRRGGLETLGPRDLIECWWRITWQALSPSISPPPDRSFCGPFHKYGNQSSRSHRPSAATTKGHSHPQLCYTPFQDTTEALVRLLAFLSPETFLRRPYRTLPSTTLFLAFGTLPHLQWRAGRRKKSHAAPRQKAWLRSGQRGPHPPASSQRSGCRHARWLRDASESIFQHHLEPSVSGHPRRRLGPAQAVGLCWSQTGLHGPQGRPSSSVALGGTPAWPESPEGERRLQGCLRVKLQARLHPATRSWHRKSTARQKRRIKTS